MAVTTFKVDAADVNDKLLFVEAALNDSVPVPKSVRKTLIADPGVVTVIELDPLVVLSVNGLPLAPISVCDDNMIFCAERPAL